MTAVKPRIKIEHVAPAKLTPAPYNPRTMTDEARAALTRGIETFGLVDPIIARRSDGLVVGGHQRLEAAKALGLETVPVVYIDADDNQAAALNVLLNNPSAQGEWDVAKLSALLSELDGDGFDATLTGFADAELERLLTWAPEQPTEADDDDAPEPLTSAPKTHTGDVITLGRHRLTCGDATDQAAWDRLLGDRRAALLWTDPPYGISYVGGTADALRIENDDLDEEALTALLRDAFSLGVTFSEPGAAWYVASPGGLQMYAFATVLRELGIWRQTIQWVKDSLVLGHSDFHYRHESIFAGATPAPKPKKRGGGAKPAASQPLLYGWVPGAAHHFVRDRTLDTVWEVARPKRSTEHPTMKPVELIKRAIRASTPPGALVVDCFAGSGSTVIAAERTGRVAAAIEKDPKYCDVIVARWEQATGQTAVRP